MAAGDISQAHSVPEEHLYAAATDMQPRSRWRSVLGSLIRDRWAALALVVLAIFILGAILAPWIAPADPDAQSSLVFGGPSWQHLLGTDDRGRDVLSRLIYGGRASLGVGAAVVLLAALVAVPLGLVAGYRRGKADFLLMRVAEVGLSVPPLVLALAVASVLGAGLVNTTVALTIVFIPTLMRLVRGQALAVSVETFVEASRVIGTPGWRILLTRVLPSVASTLFVQGTIMLGGALLAEASLSFLGLGTKPPNASWGGMLRGAYDAALFTEPWLVLIPGIAIAVTVVAINKVGDALREGLGVSRGVVRGRRVRLGLTSVRRDRVSADDRAPSPKRGRPAGPNQRPILEIRDLTVQLSDTTAADPAVKVVESVDITLRRGEILGLVGESGAGKSVTATAIMRLLSSPPLEVASGSILVDGVDVLKLSRAEMMKLRGPQIAMIFQDPMTSLDPAFTIGHHLAEAIRCHRKASRQVVHDRSVELLELVGITEPERRLRAYPHELSGGMRQRVMIAVALSCEPKLLIADEPTTALDVTVQAQILDLLKTLVAQLDMSLLIVTHDLGVIADVCDRVAVMYAGQIIEEAEVHTLFAHPQHPYTEGLLCSMPRLDQTTATMRAIPGVVPALTNLPVGCRFAARCGYAVDSCQTGPIKIENRAEGGVVRCGRAAELKLLGTSAVLGSVAASNETVGEL